MIRVLQISIEVNSGSVGRIAEQIGERILDNNGESYITYARNNLPSKSATVKIGNQLGVLWHVLMTRISDNHGFESKRATENLIKYINKLKPSIIHLHHLHGYFVNIEILFNFLSKMNIPVVWTFHDCWSFTGHCTHYEAVGCERWKTQCYECPQKNEYPKSVILDRSFKNYIQKKELFNKVKNLTIVPVSYWLEEEVKKSFLKNHKTKVIHNGIDLNKFHPKKSKNAVLRQYGLDQNITIILGVASTWSHKKGLEYFSSVADLLDGENYRVILVGLDDLQISSLNKNIIGIKRTESVEELADLYSAADVFVNPTLEESLGLTNIEALACGTPVVTFKSGGSPECINVDTGIVVDKGDLKGLVSAIVEIVTNSKQFYTKNCVQRAHSLFNKNDRYDEYIDLYKSLIR